MTISSGNNFSAYYVKSNFHFMGKQMKFGGCNPKKNRFRFFNNQCYYNESLVQKNLLYKENRCFKNHSNRLQNFDTYNETKFV
jgi:hypothetical protein